MGCLLSSLACCFCSSAASCCCSFLPSCKSSTSARAMYGLILLFGIILACIALAPGLSATLAKIPALCSSVRIDGIDTGVKTGLNCQFVVGYSAVYRVCFALTLFYAFFCVLMLCVSSSRDPRAKIQNGFWCFKFLMFIGLLVASFFIQTDHLSFRFMVAGMVGAFIFNLVQMALLIDFTHAWNGAWLEEYQSNNSYKHYCGLLFFTIIFYVIAMAAAVLLFVFYTAPDDCTLNKFFIGFNLSLCIVISVISLLPKVQEATPTSGILQSSIISIYIMYLTWSAMSSNSSFVCNPEYRSLLNMTHPSSDKPANRSVLIRFDAETACGVFIMFGFVIYAAFQGSAHTSVGRLTMSSDAESAVLTEAPRTTAADMEGQSGQKVWDDEEEHVSYSYSRMHFIFMLGSLFVMMTLTKWYVPNNKYILEPNSASMWVKIAGSWICVLLYIWTLVAPIVLPNRDFS